MWNLTWEEQPKLDPKRNVFHLEHIFTGNMCWRAIRGLWREQNNRISAQNIVSLLNDNYAVAWILKEENKRLSDDRGNTLTEAFNAYRNARIGLIDRSHQYVTDPFDGPCP